MSIQTALARVDQITSMIDGLTGGSTATSAATSTGTTATTATTTSTDTTPFATSLATATAAQTAVTQGQRPQPGLPTSGADAVPASLKPLINRAAQQAGVDPALVAAVARAESSFNVTAGSPAGARGLMQLMPGTARGLGVTDILDPAQNLAAGSRYLKQQIDTFGDLRSALAAYNAGPNAVRRYGGVPPYTETQNYVTKVLGYYDTYRGATSSTN
ncbi:MAG: lytic transglycosylase domain-containing protein [Thermoleophilia bacterium]